MEILEFGNKVNKKIILIHGFQSPYQVWNKYIEYYKKDFHIIVPILPGHNPQQKEDFVSFKKTAKEIEDYYISRYGDNLYAMYGMSMGGVLVATIWENTRLNIEKVIFDGSPLVSYNSFIRKSILNFYLNITHKAQKRDKKTVEQAINTIISEENSIDFLNVLDHMSDATINNCIKGVGNYKLPNNINTLNTKIYFFHGTKVNEMYARKTARYIVKNYPDATIKCFKGKGHCENALINPEIMIQELNDVLNYNS